MMASAFSGPKVRVERLYVLPTEDVGIRCNSIYQSKDLEIGNQGILVSCLSLRPASCVECGGEEVIIAAGASSCMHSSACVIRNLFQLFEGQE
jgi:hypothetical protein